MQFDAKDSFKILQVVQMAVGCYLMLCMTNSNSNITAAAVVVIIIIIIIHHYVM